MIHVVSVAHQLHNVAKTVRKSFPDVHAVLFGINLFKKLPGRNQKLREICPDLTLPSEPVSQFLPDGLLG